MSGVILRGIARFSCRFPLEKRRNEKHWNRRILVKYWRILAMRVVFASLALSAVAFAAPAPPFYKDVLPVLENNCQGCHRPGEPGPMSFMSYESTRPWAKSIRQAVVSKTMPPWFADPAHGHFSNDRSLSAADINTLVSWVDTGAKAGDAKDAPKPMPFL